MRRHGDRPGRRARAAGQRADPRPGAAHRAGRPAARPRRSPGSRPGPAVALDPRPADRDPPARTAALRGHRPRPARCCGAAGPLLAAAATATATPGSSSRTASRASPSTTLSAGRLLPRAGHASSSTPPSSRPSQLLPGLDTQRVRDLAATLFAAEAAGVAAWCSGTAAGYAGIRRQFGRPIGSFQAVKHLCATMACRAERAAALAWDAARAADDAPGEHPLAAAAAAALALDDAVDNAKDCIQVLGGIGFTWEHDAHLYLRRALALRQLLGGSRAWRTTARPRWPPPAPGGPSGPRPSRSRAPTRASAPGPAPRSRVRQPGPAGPLPRPHQAGRDHLVPAVQRARGRFRPRVAADQGASSRADGGLGWLHAARRCGRPWPARRTGPSAWPAPTPTCPSTTGITYFLVDMHAPGIDIRPLREITGRADVQRGLPGRRVRARRLRARRAGRRLAGRHVHAGHRAGGDRRGQDEAVESCWPPCRPPDYAERAGYARGQPDLRRRPAGRTRGAPRRPQAARHRAPPGGRRDGAGAARPGRRRRERRPARSSCSPGACPSPAAPPRSC